MSGRDIQDFYEKLDTEAEQSGYHLNPDTEFVQELVKGLLVNQKRYGYQACPCRLASGDKQKDVDIICPCDYRDQDLTEYGACYCALYVSEAVVKGEKAVTPIPERRFLKRKSAKAGVLEVAVPVWRCKVCGYLCAREGPPEVCPICKAKRERFERFM